MIQEINDILLIPNILELARKIPDIPFKEFEDMLVDGMSSRDTKILVERKDGQMRGFIFGSIERYQGKNVVFIQLSYVNPRLPRVCSELLARLRDWGKEKNIKDMIFITQREPKAFAKKYKFKLESYVLTKEIK